MIFKVVVVKIYLTLLFLNFVAVDSFIQKFHFQSIKKSSPFHLSDTLISPKQQLAVDQLLDKVSDTLEDFLLHFRRYFSSFYKLEKTRFRNITHSDINDPRPRVVGLFLDIIHS